jgi:hypothetical protein
MRLAASLLLQIGDDEVLLQVGDAELVLQLGGGELLLQIGGDGDGVENSCVQCFQVMLWYRLSVKLMCKYHTQ